MTRVVTLLGYAVLLVTAVALQLMARAHDRATFGDVVTLALRRRPVRIVVLAAWLWLGWHVFVRVDWQ